MAETTCVNDLRFLVTLVTISEYWTLNSEHRQTSFTCLVCIAHCAYLVSMHCTHPRSRNFWPGCTRQKCPSWSISECRICPGAGCRVWPACACAARGRGRAAPRPAAGGRPGTRPPRGSRPPGRGQPRWWRTRAPPAHDTRSAEVKLGQGIRDSYKDETLAKIRKSVSIAIFK